MKASIGLIDNSTLSTGLTSTILRVSKLKVELLIGILIVAITYMRERANTATQLFDDHPSAMVYDSNNEIY